jgi:hypothetical protein
MPGGAHALFIENVGQFDPRVRFQVPGGDRTIWLGEDAIWVTLRHPSSTTPAVNVQLSFPGANPHPTLQPIERLATMVNYFIGNDPTRWHSAVPTWSGVRYAGLYPGVDLEVRDTGGALTLRLVVHDADALRAVRLRIAGSERVEWLPASTMLRLETARGAFYLPPLEVVRPDGTPLSLPEAAPQVDALAEPGAYEIAAPFAVPRADVSDQTTAFGLLYATFLGGSSYDLGTAIAVDATGAAYVTGATQSNNFPTTDGAYDRTFNGGTDVFVAKLNPAGSALVYATFIGGSQGDWGYGIAVDGSGAAYVTGTTQSSNFPKTAGTYRGGGDAFGIKLRPTGALAYATFLGGSEYDVGNAIAVDGSGAAYITGSTRSADFPTTSGAFDNAFGGGTCGNALNTYPCPDAFVVKLNAAGSLDYATFLGGGDEDGGAAIAVRAGAAYVAGNTFSTDFLTTDGAYDRMPNGGDDAFVAKLDAAGSALEYATFLGGSAADWAAAIAVDTAGAAYVTGSTESGNFPTAGGAYDPTYNGGTDVFVAKLNPGGAALAYATFLGGGGEDNGFGIAVGADGAMYITGGTRSVEFPVTLGAADPVYMNGEAFLVKLLAGGALAHATFLGGSDDEWANAVAVDATGHAYLAGITRSADFPRLPGAFDPTHNGRDDAFVARLKSFTVLPVFLPLIRKG